MAVVGWAVAAVALALAAFAFASAARHRRVAEAAAATGREYDRLRARAETLAVADEQLRRALHAIPQGVIIGDAAGTISFHNDAAADFIAARHGEALVEAAIDELLAEAVAGRVATRTLELFGPPRRVLLVSASPLPGAAPAGLIVVDDVSERRRIDAVRRDFVANISHELKTPVGALGLLAETIQDEPDVAVVHRLADRMVNESFRVASTIDDLLELSRIEGGEDPIREPVPAGRVVADAVDRVRAAAEMQRITIEVDEVPARVSVLGDRRQLTSALTNLLDNALKYSDAGSTISIAVRASVDRDATTSVEIDVADQGVGIPQRDLDRIFERFYRVDQARSRSTGGTGLGLSIVRHVMANHDGEVTVRSQEGSGSTFTLRLPAGPGPVMLTAPKSHTG